MDPNLELQQQTSVSDLIRYDNEFAFNAYAICKTFHDDAHAVVDLITYIAIKYQRSVSKYYFSNNTYQLDIELEFKVKNNLREYFTNLYPGKSQEEIEVMVKNEPVLYLTYDDIAEILKIPRSKVKNEHLRPQYLIDEFGNSFLDELAIINVYNKKDKLGDLINHIRSKGYIPEPKLAEMLKVTRNGAVRTDKIADAAKRAILKKYKNKYPYSVHYDTWCDNALYRIAFEKIKVRFETKNKTRNERSQSSVLKGIDVVKFAIKHVTKGKTNRDKVVFAFCLSDIFKSNLNNFFCIIDLSKTGELHNKRLRIPHDYILSFLLILHNKAGKIALPFDRLCTVFGADNFNKPKDKETAYTRQKSYINEKFNDIVKITGYPMKLTWERRDDNSNYPNQPWIEFEKPYFEFSNVFNKLLKDKLDEEFITHFTKKNGKNPLTAVNFLNWLEGYQKDNNTFFEINAIYNKVAKGINEPSVSNTSTKEIEKFITNYILEFKKNFKNFS